MKAYKLTSGEIIVGTNEKIFNDKIVIENTHQLVLNPTGVSFFPIDLKIGEGDFTLYKEHIVGEFRVKDNIITQLKASVNGIKMNVNEMNKVNEAEGYKKMNLKI